MKSNKNIPLPKELKKIKELDLTSISNTVKGVESFIEKFDFIRPEKFKDIHIPILTALREDVKDGAAEPEYPAPVRDDIQGNVIPGFNKDHQHYLFYRIGKAKPCKKFLQWIVPHISSMEEVLAFRRLYRAKRMKLGDKGIFLCSTWLNIAFSFKGINKLTKDTGAANDWDMSFKQGLAERATFLGDPSDPRHKGHASKWKVGGPDNEADIIIIVASDTPAMMEDMVKQVNDRAADAGMELIFEQRGDTLPGDLRGHEHFGFKDGVSQPGVRGRLSSAPGDYITPRYISNTDERRFYHAKPGQLLVWPGQFLLGEQRQDPEDLHLADRTVASNFPKWAARGSYLVVRRLRQDVPAFYRFVSTVASNTGLDRDKVASMLVGRWPSGAPISRTPAAENRALGEDDFANNHFLFDDNTRPSDMVPVPGYAGDTYPQAMADFLATVCPHFAHIRKMNPRDSVTDLGKPADNLAHMILRRGIPYGRPLIGAKAVNKKLYSEDRGLMFLSYGSTIEDQFEFLQRRWANSPVQHNVGGEDPIIGQNGSSHSRERHIDFPTPGGVVRIRYKEEWVIPTGGGYFFSPTISAVRDVLGA